MSATAYLTAEAFEPHEVIVYDVDEKPIGTKQVVRRCQRCARSHHAKFGRRIFWEAVSPAGTEHIASGFGETECGIDGTGDGWWWQL